MHARLPRKGWKVGAPHCLTLLLILGQLCRAARECYRYHTSSASKPSIRGRLARRGETSTQYAREVDHARTLSLLWMIKVTPRLAIPCLLLATYRHGTQDITSNHLTQGPRVDETGPSTDRSAMSCVLSLFASREGFIVAIPQSPQYLDADNPAVVL